MARAVPITTPNDDSFDAAALPEPYAVRFTIRGTRAYLFNRYDVTPADQLKGEADRDDPGRKVTLDADGHPACNKLQLWNAVTAAGKYRKNPRSSKGSLGTILREAFEIEPDDERAPDLLTFVAPDGEPYATWQWEDQRRIKKAGAFSGFVTRTRPALHPGWRLSGRAVILLPQYVNVPQLHEAFTMAGRFGGIGDGRSGGLGFGRFLIESFEEVSLI